MKGTIINSSKIKNGYELTVLVPELTNKALDDIQRGFGTFIDMSVDDGIHVSTDQRAKIFALVRDISDFIGEPSEVFRTRAMIEFCIDNGYQLFTLSDKTKGDIERCKMSIAAEFINYLIEFHFREDIPLQWDTAEKTKEVAAHSYYAAIYNKCTCCGQKGEFHHIDTIGMGANRREHCDIGDRGIELCRKHHIEVETIGLTAFIDKYHVQPIVVDYKIAKYNSTLKKQKRNKEGYHE